MAHAAYTARSIYRRLILQARPYWLHVAGLLLLNLLGTPLALLKPIPLKIAIDSVVGSAPLPGFLRAALPGSVARSGFRLLLAVVALEVLIVLLNQFHSLVAYLLRTLSGERLTLDLRARLFRHLQRLSLSFHDARGTADSIYRVQDDAPSIRWIIIDGLLPFLTESFTLVAMIFVMVRIDWRLALVALGISPFLFLYARVYDKRVGSRYSRMKELESSALHVIQEVLSAVRVVKAFGREESEQERFVRYSGAGLRARIRLAFAEGALGLVVNMTIAIGTALVLFVGIRNIQSGILTVGDLLVIMTYLAQLYGPLETISQQAASLQSYRASAQRVFEVLDEVSEVEEKPNARPLKRTDAAIDFRNVSFSYDGRNQVLRNVSFVAPPGTRVGIAGKTGAGKTTLISLLIRFYDPASGQILIDGVDMRDYQLADLRAQFSLVLQDSVLFSTTIAENIAYARPGATREEIVEAAKAAKAHDFIMALPDGYETEVGERGMMVSGGERQRISLARAFLKNAPILILDEPTSSVDVKTEADILETMERLMRGRTSFIISHRLSALKNCDLLLKVEQGQPIEVIESSRQGDSIRPLEAIVFGAHGSTHASE